MSSSSPSSSSPHHSRGGGDNGTSSKSKGEDRPCFFDSKAKSNCWAKADVVPGRHPERWRKDAAGNVVCKHFCNCQSCLCFKYDHIVPFSKGGESTEDNCQILQTRVNRFKSGKDQIDKIQLKGYSCDVIYSQVIVPNGDAIRVLWVGSTNLLRFWYLNGAYFFTWELGYKELDIIEMAVYGDVIRPGNQSRCRTVAEMLGQYKAKDKTAACKLP
ncbi:unnamed protein product [Prunus armeniaca]|uniref:HNH domain-containing protein n=1 Tax=Prunus armeniaca TaxID=36596 RepID=A0A6J5XKC0_PRUAR|nr:unnamed protein product [Prunus armeniaca]